jgi:hypothetical protein
MSDNKNYNQKLDNAWFILRKKKKSEKRFKSLSIALFFIFTFFVISEVSATECVIHRGGYFNETYQADLTYYTHENTNLETCIDFVLMSGLEYSALKQRADMMDGLNEIDAISIAESFTWGFGTWISFWWLGYVIRNAKMVIKRA